MRLAATCASLTLVSALASAQPVKAANTPAMNAVQALCDAWVHNANLEGKARPWNEVVKPWSTPAFWRAIKRGDELQYDADPLFDTQNGIFGAVVKPSKHVAGGELVPVYGKLGLNQPGELAKAPVYAKVVARGGRWLVDDWQTGSNKSVKAELTNLKPFR